MLQYWNVFRYWKEHAPVLNHVPVFDHFAVLKHNWNELAPEPTPGTTYIHAPHFRRFSRERARAMLAEHYLLIVGDSVARYWYMSLAYFLHSGDTLKTWDAIAKQHEHPLVLFVDRGENRNDLWLSCLACSTKNS